MTIGIDEIEDDSGYAVVMAEDMGLRVDVFPPAERGIPENVHRRAHSTISLTAPELTASQARHYAQLLLAAADLAGELRP